MPGEPAAKVQTPHSSFTATIVTGHGVASGRSGDARFPGGTIRMQRPHFLALGLDLSRYHPGTLNVSLAPLRYTLRTPRHTFRAVKWHPTEPAEDFSFVDVKARLPGEREVQGLIYHPHPETKPEHFQCEHVLELLLPWMGGLACGLVVRLDVPTEQMSIHAA